MLVALLQQHGVDLQAGRARAAGARVPSARTTVHFSTAKPTPGCATVNPACCLRLHDVGADVVGLRVKPVDHPYVDVVRVIQHRPMATLNEFNTALSIHT